jgi:hypothetical protein
MKLTFRATRRMLGGTALVCAAALLPGTAPSTAGPAKPAKSAWFFPRCKESQVTIWLGIPGSGAAGTIFYPLEFSNTSNRSCSLFGYPTVKAIEQDGKQIGKASGHLGQRHGIVNLLPGATAHATLGIVEAGNVCTKPVGAAGLSVRAPGQWSSTVIPYFFLACHGKRILHVGPIQPGVGIPGRP